MKKNIISCILMASLLFSFGCYTNQTITREQLDNIPNEGLKAEFEQHDITVYTKDSLEYTFLKDNYRIESDTLMGSGEQTIAGNNRPFNGSISFGDITLLKTENFDTTATIVAIGLPVGLAVGFLLVLAAGLSKI